MASMACSSDSCDKPTEHSCAGCRATPYCSKECQKAHWKTHKLTCPAARKYNCYLLHAPPNGIVGDVSSHIEPFHLRNYGRETGEHQELKERLGWGKPIEAGKFYDHIGTDEWYYWVYADGKAKAAGKPPNVLSKRLCYKEVHGDLAVLRSGPEDTTAPELFTRTALASAVEFYETESRSKVFQSREKSRAARKFGFNLSNPHIYTNSATYGPGGT